MRSKQQIAEEAIKCFMNDCGYEHNNRFSDKNSPYCGQQQWHVSTEKPTGVELNYRKNTFIASFEYRNVSVKYSVETSFRFLDRNNYAYNKKYQIEDSEKGWFTVKIALNTEKLLSRYELYDEWLETELTNYNLLMNKLEKIAYKSDIASSIDMIHNDTTTYLSFGNESNHLSVSLGKKNDSFFGIIYININGEEVYKSKYYQDSSIDLIFKALINELTDASRSYNMKEISEVCREIKDLPL